DLGTVPVAQLGQPLDPAVTAGRQYVHGHVVGQRGHLLHEPVPAGDLGRDQPHLPGAARRSQRLLDAPHAPDADAPRPQPDRPADRDAVHQATVEVVLTVDTYGWQQARYGGRGEHGRDDGSTVEPMRGRPFDVGGHALEGHRELIEIVDREVALD